MAKKKKTRVKLSELNRRSVVAVFKKLNSGKMSMAEGATALGCCESNLYYHLRKGTYDE